MLSLENAAARASAFIDSIPPCPGHFHGRGIITCAGGVNYLTCAWIQIALLRRLGCILPIEVWYLGEDEGDLAWMDLVRPLGADCVDAFAVRQRAPHPRLRGWEAKVYAILHSRFEEVLFLDADNVAVVDPTPLFDLAEYRETGAVFWPDATLIPRDHPAWRVFDVPAREERAFETGQVLVHKRRCWRPLHLCNWYNENSDFFYRYVHGDKETFHFAWHRLGQPFTFAPAPPEPAPFGLIQFDLAGRPLFQHRIRDKWRLTGNRRCAEFEHEEACLDFLRRLAGGWDPTRHLTRRLTGRDRLQMESVAGRVYRLVVGSGRSFPVELRADGWVGGRPDLREHFWWCSRGRLVLAGADGRPTAELDEQSDGVWQGRSSARGDAEVRLVRLRRNLAPPLPPRVIQPAKPWAADAYGPVTGDVPCHGLNGAHRVQRSTPMELPAGCFNPSIVRHQGRLLCAYRKLVSASENYVYLVCLDEKFQPEGDGIRLEIPVALPMASCWEDPRLFRFHDRLFCSFTYWSPALGSDRTAVGLCEIGADLTVKCVRFPRYGFNHNVCTGGSSAGQEKNWVFFECNDRLYFIYETMPFEVVEYHFDSDRVGRATRTTGPANWLWGTIRGGTPPVLAGDRYFSFFHSSLRHHGRWTYYAGLLTFLPERPFRIEQLSTQPLLAGTWEPGCDKAVVFPGGAIHDDAWSVACGINDKRCATFSFTADDLRGHLERRNDG